MSDANREIDILKGEPIEVSIGGKTRKILRLSVDAQFEVMDLLSKQSNLQSIKDISVGMIKVISLALGRTVELNEFISAGEVVNVFNAIWKQNEFDFLSEQVAKIGKTKV